MSASPRSSAASSSLVNKPLPPRFSSDHSVCLSPVVTIRSSSVSTPSFARRCAATISVWARASGLLRVAMTRRDIGKNKGAENNLRASGINGL